MCSDCFLILKQNRFLISAPPSVPAHSLLSAEHLELCASADLPEWQLRCPVTAGQKGRVWGVCWTQNSTDIGSSFWKLEVSETLFLITDYPAGYVRPVPAYLHTYTHTHTHTHTHTCGQAARTNLQKTYTCAFLKVYAQSDQFNLYILYMCCMMNPHTRIVSYREYVRSHVKLGSV